MTASQGTHDSTSFISSWPPVDIATLLNLLDWDKKTQKHFLAGTGVFVLFSEKRSQPNKEKAERSFMASDCLLNWYLSGRLWERKQKLSVSSLDWDPALSVADTEAQEATGKLPVSFSPSLSLLRGWGGTSSFRQVPTLTKNVSRLWELVPQSTILITICLCKVFIK